MHEVSLVQNMLQAVAEEFPDRFQFLSVIRLKAGLLSNVQPVLIQNALAAIICENPGYAGLQIEVELLPVLIHCSACDKTTEVTNYRFVCDCGRPCKNLVQGDELLISQVVFRDEEGCTG